MKLIKIFKKPFFSGEGGKNPFYYLNEWFLMLCNQVAFTAILTMVKCLVRGFNIIIYIYIYSYGYY